MSRLIVLALTCSVAVAHADSAPPDEEVARRFHYIQKRLKAEAVQARSWQTGWSIVDTGGLGYSAYQISQSSTKAELAEGIVGAVKSLNGVAFLALTPLKTARGEHELDGLPDATPEARRQSLLLAESLLARNAKEADLRFSWKPHVYLFLISVVGGGIVWACGDLTKGAESAAIGFAVGELQIWTRPWLAKRDLREYRRDFGGLVGSGSPPLASAPAASVHLGPSSVRVTF